MLFWFNKKLSAHVLEGVNDVAWFITHCLMNSYNKSETAILHVKAKLFHKDFLFQSGLWQMIWMTIKHWDSDLDLCYQMVVLTTLFKALYIDFGQLLMNLIWWEDV